MCVCVCVSHPSGCLVGGAELPVSVRVEAVVVGVVGAGHHAVVLALLPVDVVSLLGWRERERKIKMLLL